MRRYETVDVIVGGSRGPRLLLGLRDPAGLLHHVGDSVPVDAATWAALSSLLQTVPRGAAFTGRPPGIGWWRSGRYEDWIEYEPTVVVEVSGGAVDEGRFRNQVRVLRVRRDKLARDCAMVVRRNRAG